MAGRTVSVGLDGGGTKEPPIIPPKGENPGTAHALQKSIILFNPASIERIKA